MLIKKQPDIILLNLAICADNVYNIIPGMLETAYGARLIILTQSLNPQAHRIRIDLGAKGLVLKHKSSEALINAVHKLNAGEISLGP